MSECVNAKMSGYVDTKGKFKVRSEKGKGRK